MAKPQGKLVQVNRGKMHIRQMGSGEKNNRFFAGIGLSAPYHTDYTIPECINGNNIIISSPDVFNELKRLLR